MPLATSLGLTEASGQYIEAVTTDYGAVAKAERLLGEPLTVVKRTTEEQ